MTPPQFFVSPGGILPLDVRERYTLLEPQLKRKFRLAD